MPPWEKVAGERRAGKAISDTSLRPYHIVNGHLEDFSEHDSRDQKDSEEQQRILHQARARIAADLRRHQRHRADRDRHRDQIAENRDHAAQEPGIKADHACEN